MHQLRHVGIVVQKNKLKKMLKFYEILGFYLKIAGKETKKTMKKYLNIFKSVKTYKLYPEKANACIELLVFKSPIKRSPSKATSLGITHFAITVNNLKEIKQKIKNNDKCIETDIFQKTLTSPKVLFCKDPCGNIIELVEDIC